MSQTRVTDGLLAIIAACLILIAVKLYATDLVPSAYAQWHGRDLDGDALIPVALHARNVNGLWYPCQMSDGDKLYVQPVD